MKAGDIVNEFKEVEKEWRTSKNPLFMSEIIEKIDIIKNILSRAEKEKIKALELIFSYKKLHFESNDEPVNDSLFGEIHMRNSKSITTFDPARENSITNRSLNSTNGQPDWFKWF